MDGKLTQEEIDELNGAASGLVRRSVLRWSGDSVIVNGVERRIKPIERFLAPGIVRDHEENLTFGLRSSYVDGETSGFYRLYDVLRAPHCGGVIIGEGDSGKSWYVNMMEAADCPTCRVRVFRLRNYIGAPRELVREVENCRALADEARDGLTVVFDGLDENKSSGSVLAEIVGRFARPNRLRIWVTSRLCGALNLLKEQNILAAYHLAPFSEDEVEELAAGVGVDSKAFFAALWKDDMSALASTPGGLVTLLDEYGKKSFDSRTTTSHANLTHEIVKRLVLESRDGRTVPACETRFGNSELTDCAGWIATAMWLSGKSCIDRADIGTTPAEALRFNLLCRGRYERKIVQAMMDRRIFEPLSEDLVRFVNDEEIVPFLVAQWLLEHAKEDIHSLLPTGQRIDRGLAYVLRWVAVFRPELSNDWLKTSPSFFLDCREAVRLFGLERFYALFERDRIKASEFSGFLFSFPCKRLEGWNDLGTVAASRFQGDVIDSRKAKLAANVIRYVGRADDFGAMARCLAKHWNSFDTQNRIEILNEMSLMDTDCPELDDLKPHLDDTEDGVEQIGKLLALLWPRHLTVDELLTHLRKLSRAGLDDMWDWYDDLEITFDQLEYALRTKLDRESAVPCLEWAVALNGADSERIGDSIVQTLGTSIFIGAWRWAKEPEIARFLAQIIDVYGGPESDERFTLPWHEFFRTSEARRHQRNKAGRMAVLEAYARIAHHGERHFKSMVGCVEPFWECRMGLVYPGDSEALEALWRKLDGEEPGGIVAQRVKFALEAVKSGEFVEAEFPPEPKWNVNQKKSWRLPPDSIRLFFGRNPPVDDNVLDRLAAEPQKARAVPTRRKKTGQMDRVNNDRNAAKLCEYLKEQMSTLLSMKSYDQRIALQKELSKGSFLAKQAKIRVGTVGEIITLENARQKTRDRNRLGGHTEHPMAQMFYKVCTNADMFSAFETYAKSFRRPVSEMRADAVFAAICKVAQSYK